MKRSNSVNFFNAMLTALTFLALMVPLTQVAPTMSTYYYAVDQMTAENQPRTTPYALTQVTGGGVSSALIGEVVPEHFLETFRPAPGYQVLWSSSGRILDITHPNFENAHQTCHWHFILEGLELPLTCFARL